MKSKNGILGGGQLGKMLYSSAIKMDMPISFMDSMTTGPVAKVASEYRQGNIQDFDDVVAFSESVDVLSIEIEKVNVAALKSLDKEKSVFPQPDVIEIIQDKGLQKKFYDQHNLPSSPYRTYVNRDQIVSDLEKGVWTFPFIQKLRKDGYDGRGVKVIRTSKDLQEGFEAPSLVEEMISIEKELAVVTCRGKDGQVVSYDPVEMVFHPDQNILLYQLAPARVDQSLAQKAQDLAKKVSEAFGIVGLLAVEMFLTTDGALLINEVAPRPHNSGHHTIEACLCSQYENHLRAISGLPLGSPSTLCPSLLMNVLGDDGFTGPVFYQGLNEVLALAGVNTHLYGKTVTKPFRKMGHISILSDDYDDLIQKYEMIRRTLRVRTTQ